MPSSVVVITGSSSGIGQACALEFARRGYTVCATARRPESLAELAAVGCSTWALDVTDDASVDAAIAAIEAAHGRIDILINNAGYGQQGAVEETSIDQFRQQMETNLFGVIRVSQRVLPGMRARGAGRILMMSSMGGRITFPGGAAYHASKFALEALSDVLRFEVAKFGVDIVVVQPGLVATDYGTRSLADLAGRDSGPYAAFTAGVRAALEGSFSGAVEGTSTAEEVALACADAAAAVPAPTRVIVGAMAEQLIGLRSTMSDPQWDDMMTTMYPQPAP